MASLSRNLVNEENIRPIADLKKFENDPLEIQICYIVSK